MVGTRLSPALLNFENIDTGTDALVEKVRLISVAKSGLPTGTSIPRVDHPALSTSSPRSVEDGISEFDVKFQADKYVGGIYSRIIVTLPNGDEVQGTVTAKVPCPFEVVPETLIFDRSHHGQILLSVTSEEIENVSTTSDLVEAVVDSKDTSGGMRVNVIAKEGMDWGNRVTVKCCLLVRIKDLFTLSVPITILKASH